jgi:hypothetical protein
MENLILFSLVWIAVAAVYTFRGLMKVSPELLRTVDRSSILFGFVVTLALNLLAWPLFMSVDTYHNLRS